MTDVSVVIVTYNAAEWVPRCLAAVPAAAERVSIETIVVDNGSTEYTPEDLRGWLGDQPGQVIAGDNVGFGRGCHRAAEVAQGEFLLLLNPDAVIAPGSIDALVEFHRSHPDVGIVGGRVLAPEGTLDYGSCFGFQTLWSLFCFATGLSTVFPRSPRWNPEGLGDWRRDSERRVDIVTGCLLLIDRALWDRLGGFDRSLFMYGEDSDLCRRAFAAGAESWITPGAQVVHAVGASSATNVVKQVMLFKGKASLARKDFLGARRVLALLLLQSGVAARALGEWLLQTDRASWRGLWNQRREWTAGW